MTRTKLNPERIQIVKERIALVNKLTSVRESFRGNQLIEGGGKDNSWTHPYKHYAALRNYLLLTCFDILGQTEDYIDFFSWLQSKKLKEERENIIKKCEGTDIVLNMINVHKEYNSIYGISKSFHRFIYQILSDENRNKLFDSIDIKRRSVSDSKPIEINVSEKMKSDFLFLIRNSFTHKGKALASPTGGVYYPFDGEEKPFFDPVLKKEMWGYFWNYSEVKEKYRTDYFARKWPSLLVEIIEDTIK